MRVAAAERVAVAAVEVVPLIALEMAVVGDGVDRSVGVGVGVLATLANVQAAGAMVIEKPPVSVALALSMTPTTKLKAPARDGVPVMLSP